jgi:hypothetical protein
MQARTACAGSGTRVDSGSSVEVVMALININPPRKTAHSCNGVVCHFNALDQDQQGWAERY